MQSKHRSFEKAKSDWLAGINSWADIYNFFDGLMSPIKEYKHPITVFNALFILYGFILAMKELPAEKDAKILFERMLRIVLLEGKEKIGSEIVLITGRDLEEIKRLYEEQVSRCAGTSLHEQQELLSVSAKQISVFDCVKGGFVAKKKEKREIRQKRTMLH